MKAGNPKIVVYYFDSQTLALKRVMDKLSEIIDEEGKLDPQLKSPAVIYLSKIKEVSFSYLYLDLAKNAYLWKEQWQEEYLPLAVKLSISSEKKKYESTVYLPRI